MALGEKLRDARLKRNLTTSQVAAATRMKAQTVEALENEDFSKIPAPIYGKGFIRLYAQLVGIDPRPLVDEYASALSRRKTPSPANEASRPGAGGPGAAAARAAGRKAGSGAKAVPYNEGEFRILGKAREAQTASPPGAAGGGADVRSAPVESAPEDADLFSRAAPAEASAPERVQGPLPRQTSERPAVLTETPRKAESLTDGAEPPPSGAASLRTRAASVWHARRELGRSWTLFDFRNRPVRSASVLTGILVVTVLILSSFSRCGKHPKMSAHPPVKPHQELQVVVQPPDPYFD